MTAEQSHDPLDHELREVLHTVHARLEAPAFDEVWGEARMTAKRLQRRHLPRLPRTAAAWAAAVALVALIVVAVGLPPPAPEEAQDPLPGFAGDARHPSVPVVWYAPTDELLQVTSLGYTDRPAAMTIYDPINLEVRP